MSQSSCMSEISVSYCGQEVPLEVAVDSIFKELQTFLNTLQCSLRSLAMLTEQDGNYPEAVQYSDEIEDGIDGMQHLFKDLKDITSQVMVKPETVDEREYLKKHKAERKQKKDEELKLLKEAAKMAKVQLKDIPE